MDDRDEEKKPRKSRDYTRVYSTKEYSRLVRRKCGWAFKYQSSDDEDLEEIKYQSSDDEDLEEIQHQPAEGKDTIEGEAKAEAKEVKEHLDDTTPVVVIDLTEDDDEALPPREDKAEPKESD